MTFPRFGLHRLRARDSLVTSVCLASVAGLLAAVAPSLIADLRSRTLVVLARARALLLKGRRRRRRKGRGRRRRPCARCCSDGRDAPARGTAGQIVCLPKLYVRETVPSRAEDLTKGSVSRRSDACENTGFVYERVTYPTAEGHGISDQVAEDVSQGKTGIVSRGMSSNLGGVEPIFCQRYPYEVCAEPVTPTPEGIRKVITCDDSGRRGHSGKPRGVMPIVCEGLSMAFRSSVEPVTPEPTADDDWNMNNDDDVKPPSWRSFSLSASEEGEGEEWQLYGELDDSCSCQTEKQFIADLEERLGKLGVCGRIAVPSMENEVDDDSQGEFAQECINLYQTGYSEAVQGNHQDFTVFEYCNLFYRGQKVTIDMYDEYIEWLRGLQKTSSA